MQIVLTSEVLLAAYSQGIFPMAEKADSPYVHWYCPEMRGQLSIENLHISRSLKKTVLNHPYEISVNTDFRQVIQCCAEARDRKRKETWINQEIIEAFCKLHNEGYAHSVECREEGRLVGGLYGMAIGGAFFGESMFSKVTDASKICLVHLAARLWAAGFTVLDTQFVNPHLQQFGVYEVSYKEYMKQLSGALKMPCDFVKDKRDEKVIVREYLARLK